MNEKLDEARKVDPGVGIGGAPPASVPIPAEDAPRPETGPEPKVVEESTVETEKENEGRDEEAKAKEQGEGLGPRETPPGQEKKEDEPVVDNTLPEEPAPPEA